MLQLSKKIELFYQELGVMRFEEIQKQGKTDRIKKSPTVYDSEQE